VNARTPPQEITLVPLSDEDRDEFFREEIANYADQQIRDAGWSPDDALDRAHSEFTPVLEREFAEAVAQGHRLWSAMALTGRSVGWLWVKPIEEGPATSLYLEQITVAASCRRQGYGLAMLAALERLLAAEGIEDLRLDVSAANEGGQALYASAGYRLVVRGEGKVRLRKRLPRAEDRAD
jgi:ribosomal protein S18 acetylase RimI-like enzyme